MTYTLKLATLGTSEVTLTAAIPAAPVVTELNQPGSFSFAVDPVDPQAALIDPLEREVHVYRDGTRIFAGPIVSAAWPAESEMMRFDCEGLLAYMGMRNIDAGADRTNHLVNPQFESSPDLTGWTNVGGSASVTTSQRILGTKSAQLTAASALQDWYLYQDVAVTGTGVGSLYTLVGWFKINPTGYVGEPIGSRGLTLSRRIGSDIQQSGVEGGEIDGDTPRGSWQRAEVTVWVPPNSVETLQARLYKVGGTIWWDALSLTLMESLSSAESDTDFLMEQTTIAERIVALLQDPTYNKSDLDITYDTPSSGIERERHYQFAEHTNGLQALLEFTELDDGFDIEITPARVFKTHYPRRGTDRSATVTLKTPRHDDDTNVNCLLRRYSFDGHQAASGVAVLGQGDGPDREEGGAEDGAAFGGLTVELVVQPRATVAIDTLDEMATEELRKRINPRILELYVYDATLVATLEVGDTVDVDVAHGAIIATGDWRIVKLAESLAEECVTATLVPA